MLTPPRSRSTSVYEDWLHGTPRDEEYLDQAYEHLDQMEGAYQSWKERNGYANPYSESQEEYATRARRVAQAWKDLGWTREDVNNFLRMTPAERADFARSLALGRYRRNGQGGLANEEIALYYHSS